MKKIIALITLFILTISFTSCTDDPASVGLPLLKDEDFIRILELDSFTDSLLQQSKTIERILPLGLSETILLGKKGNVSSSILIRFFFNLNDTLIGQIDNNQVEVLSSKIEFKVNYHFGDKNAALDFSSHRVTSDWDPLTFTRNNLSSLIYDANDATLEKQMSDSIYVLTIENNLIDKWLKSAADTNLTKEYGLYIQPKDDSEKIVGFQALSSDGSQVMPKLRIVISRPGTIVDTLTFLPTADVHILQAEMPLVDERIFVQSGVSFNSKIWFDVSGLPDNAIINNAKLTLTPDTLSQFFGSDYIDFVVARFLTDTSTVTIDDERFARIDIKNGLYEGDIAQYVQRWNRKESNLGVLITSAIENEGVEIFSFYSSDAADPAFRPRLEIIYTEKK